MSVLNRAKMALNGEQGGPSVETIIGIAVAIIMGVALIAFGNIVVGKTREAGNAVGELTMEGQGLGHGDFGTTPTTP